MTIPFSYIIKNFTARKVTSLVTLTGIGLVVFVFAAVLMMATGIEKTLVATGTEGNVIIARKSSSGEITSIIDRATMNVLLTTPGVATASDGTPLVTTDGVAILNLTKRNGGMSNVAARGVSPQVMSIRSSVKIVAGRMFNFGTRELIVGESCEKNFLGTHIGERVKIGSDEWLIVGVMASGGTGFDSEVWCDIEQLQQALNRNQSFSTITFRIEKPDMLEGFQMRLARDPRLNQFEAETEKRFYAKQSETMSIFIRVLGIFTTLIFSTGAIIGAMITMYAAVANRTTEIGTLRALGFQRSSILYAFLAEALVLSLIGGMVGTALASLLQFVSISTLNFGSFSEVSFSFAMTPDIVITAMVFSLVMGFVGGFLPAWRASLMDILAALRGG